MQVSLGSRVYYVSVAMNNSALWTMLSHANFMTGIGGVFDLPGIGMCVW